MPGVRARTYPSRDRGREAAIPAIQLTADNRAPGRAREFIESVCNGAPGEVRARACQVVSELVTNSVRHGGSTIRLDACSDGNGGLDIDVRDDGPGFDLQPRAAGHAETHGWGLVFVDMLADSWAAGGPGAPVVWAHFEPRSIVTSEIVSDPLLEERLRSLLDVRMLLDSVKDHAIFAVDACGRVTLWNVGGERLTGYSSEEMLGTSVDVLHGRPRTARDLATALAQGRHEHEDWMYRKDGSRFWCDSIITPILTPLGELRGFAVVARDGTWRKRLDEEREGLIARVKVMARTDDLTGLPNRRRWHEELDREMARARRTGKELCVAQIDLDGFKTYNDSKGHVAGDELLAKTGQAWSQTVRETDTLGRSGGDEFSLLLPECGVDEANEVVERVRDATPDPVTCSAGITCSDGAETPEMLIRRADRALYKAKRSGRNVTAIT